MYACSPSSLGLANENQDFNGMFGWRAEGGKVEGSSVEFAKNKLILC